MKNKLFVQGPIDISNNEGSGKRYFVRLPTILRVLLHPLRIGPLLPGAQYYFRRVPTDPRANVSRTWQYMYVYTSQGVRDAVRTIHVDVAIMPGILNSINSTGTRMSLRKTTITFVSTWTTNNKPSERTVSRHFYDVSIVYFFILHFFFFCF